MTGGDLLLSAGAAVMFGKFMHRPCYKLYIRACGNPRQLYSRCYLYSELNCARQAIEEACVRSRE